MAGSIGISVTIDIEPVVKLVCKNNNCRFNLIHNYDSMLCCGLKYIEIDKNKECMMYEKKETESGNK